MAEYTYESIITNPMRNDIENLIGKNVYVGDVPSYCLRNANENNSKYLAILIDIKKDHVYPFIVKRQKKKYEEAYSCIIVKKEPCCEDQVKQWIEENNLKVGDYVKVLRKTEPYENKWRSFWVDEMSDYIGKALKVLAINSLRGLISLECDDAVYDFPYFVLEKAEKPESQYVPFESKEEFVRRYTEVKEGADFDTFEDNLFQCGMWLKDKETGSFFMVTEIWDDGVIVTDRKMKTTKVRDDEYFTINESTTWKELLRDYCFIDGAPCGKESKDE